MTIEHARAQTMSKPWGVVDPGPWCKAGRDGKPIGEIWYERGGPATETPSLLLKLLLTSQPLSIQVHPDDAYAQSLGQPNGKNEAWYVLSAAPDARVALGLKRRLTPEQLRAAANDGSIKDLVSWRTVHEGDAIFVAAGTIHAIGAGLVIAEIQQRSETTFRLFDHGRGRELHIDSAVAVADAGPAEFRANPTRLTETRTLLISNSHFTFEKIDLAPNSAWRLEANQETWLFVVGGSARADAFELATGEAIFAQADRVDIRAGANGLAGLVAYPGRWVPELMTSAAMETTP